VKKLLVVMGFLLLGLQYRLWVGEGSLGHYFALKREHAKQEATVEIEAERNRILQAEVHALRQGTSLIEEKARSQLGMIKEGETFFMYKTTPTEAP
jgi:cell division protein FtsB